MTQRVLLSLTLVSAIEKINKKLDDNNQTKNDHKDPRTIARLAKDGLYIEPYILGGIYSELWTAMATYHQKI
jgi:hypothetical protein